MGPMNPLVKINPVLIVSINRSICIYGSLTKRLRFLPPIYTYMAKIQVFFSCGLKLLKSFEAHSTV